MNVQSRVSAGPAATAGGLSPEEMRLLRKEVWQDGHVGRVEAETLLLANDALRGSSPEWRDFFVEALFEHIVNSTDPKGRLDQANGRWLWSRIAGSGVIDGNEELELVVRILQGADEVAEDFRLKAMGIIERAITEGVGPTRAGKLLGREIPVGSISEKETLYLRRMVFRTDRNHPRKVGRVEAEALFRIKAATMGGDNARDWPYVFVQGVGAYLQRFDGSEPLTVDQELELMSFMTADGCNLADFLQKMFAAQAGGGIRDRIRESGLDPLERALLEFLAA